MKIYRNKLYSIQDAAKRGGVTEDQIQEMITYHVIQATISIFCDFIPGYEILGLKAKWEEWQAKKKKMKKADFKVLRYNKGN